MNKKGFTLIELLVVIAIIGVLTSFALFTYPGSQRRARDQQRRNDIQQYQIALENYALASDSLYPVRTDSEGVLAWSQLCTDLGTFLTSCPQDPTYAQNANFAYRYQSDGSGVAGLAAARNWVLWARLEGRANTYWVVCSNSDEQDTTSGIPPSGGVCPI